MAVTYWQLNWIPILLMPCFFKLVYLYRHSLDMHHRRHVTWLLPSVVWCHHTCASCADAKKTLLQYCCVTSSSMCKLHGHRENTAPILLAMCVLQMLPSNGFTYHNAPSIRLFILNSLLVCRHSFLSKISGCDSHVPSSCSLQLLPP
jgi:hypothetical protein